MAKIMVEMDTMEKTMAVTFDGKPLDNVMAVNFYCSSHDYSGMPYKEGEDHKYNCSLSIAEPHKEDGYSMYHNIVAKESEEGRRAIRDGLPESKKFPGFVDRQTAVNPELSKEIDQFMGR